MIYILCHFSIEFFYLLPSVFILVRCGFYAARLILKSIQARDFAMQFWCSFVEILIENRCILQN